MKEFGTREIPAFPPETPVRSITQQGEPSRQRTPVPGSGTVFDVCAPDVASGGSLSEGVEQRGIGSLVKPINETGVRLTASYRTSDFETVHKLVQGAIDNAKSIDNPTTAVALYEGIAEGLPAKVPAEAIEAVRGAIADGDPRGVEVLTWLHLRSVLTIVGNYEGNAKGDLDDMVQEALAIVSNRFSQGETRFSYKVLSTALDHYVAERDAVPVGWLRDGRREIFDSRMEELQTKYPYGIPPDKRRDTKMELQQLGISSTLAHGMVEYSDLYGRREPAPDVEEAEFSHPPRPSLEAIEDAVDVHRAIKRSLERPRGMTAEEADTIYRRHGFFGGSPATLGEIAEDRGDTTPGAVRDDEQRAYEQLNIDRRLEERLEPSPSPTPPRPVSLQQKIVARHQDGEGYPQICEELGLDEETVRLTSASYKKPR